MPTAPPGLEIIETRNIGPVRVTYGARQIPLGRSVQLVALAPGVLSSSPLAQALEHEAAVLAKFDHPNILKLYDLKHDESQMWLVLEDVDGPKVSELVSRNIPWQAAAAIGLDISRALSHAHSLGEIHGRLQASTVQLTKNGRTKLFGFHEPPDPRDDRGEALEPTEVGGLSPEASIGQSLSPVSDLFTLGALLYELLTGEPPFGDPKDPHYASRVRNEELKSRLGSRSEVPPTLQHLVHQCLEKAPSDRPASAEYMASRLEGLIGSSTLPILRQCLSALGFREEGAADSGAQAEKPATTEAKAFRPRRELLLLTASAFMGAALTFLVFHFGTPDATTPRSQSNVPRYLPEQKSILLRVVASPWAHVLVDGEHRETTPFARPILLAPGKHTVRLEHPHAAPEERIIDGQAGQGILLNVQLHVRKPLELTPEIPLQEEGSP